MAVNGIGGGLSAYTQYQSQMASTAKAAKDAAKPETADDGVAIEISSAGAEAAEAAKEADKTAESEAVDPRQKDYDAIIQKLNSELDAHTQQMQNLVKQLLGEQADTFQTSLADTYRKMAELADPETIEQAKKDVAEDGFWGVEKTSDRMVEMAKALAGGDSTKADELIGAVKKGFEQATSAWGEDLPEISSKTIDATIKKLEQWRDGTETTTE
ncbi:MAG: hypothetical protein K5639_08405 [Eubacterium sp.]|nr:hypothetical protein [Eubacterium sp.]